MTLQHSGFNLIDGAEIWNMHATHGVPIEISFDMVAKKKYIPTWDSFLSAAKKDGTNLERLVVRVIMCVEDSYPEHVVRMVRTFLPQLEVRLRD